MNILSRNPKSLAPSHRISFVLIGIAFFSLSLWVSLGPGDIYDESEHLHIAYLISQGQRINIDFFQHHQPLLWDILSPIYRMGVDSLIVYYIGRAIVLLCFISSILFLKEISMTMTRCLGTLDRNSTPRYLPFGGYSGLIVLSLPLISMPAMMVIRPEIIGFPAFLGSLLIWMKNKSYRTEIAAGVFMGIAAFSSVRFIVLLPLLWVFSPQKAISVTFKRILAVLAVSSASFLILASIPGRTIFDILNYLKLSALLQKTGPGNMVFADKIIISVAWALLICVFLSVRSVSKTKGIALHYSILIAILIISLVTAWPYLYPQSLIPFFCCAAIMATIMEINASYHSMFRTILLASSFLILLTVSGAFRKGIPLAKNIALKKTYLAFLKGEDTVILRSPLHPIIIKDGSFYGVPITDGGNRLCVAADKSHTFMNLPGCDYAADIQANRPVLVDVHCLNDSSIQNASHFLESFLKDYSQINPYVFIRKDRLSTTYSAQ